ncbi:MAG: hypothetical protein WCP21_01730 [Armatimonadota bacterium]
MVATTLNDVGSVATLNGAGNLTLDTVPVVGSGLRTAQCDFWGVKQGE